MKKPKTYKDAGVDINKRQKVMKNFINLMLNRFGSVFLVRLFVIVLVLSATVNVFAYSEKIMSSADNNCSQINWLISQQNQTTGLVDSYEGDETNYAYTYDQALAVIAFTSENNTGRAKAILDRFNSSQNSDGSWYLCYSANNASVCSYNKPVGDISWLIMAINYYEVYTGDKNYSDMAVKALNFLDNLRDNNPENESYGALVLSPGSTAYSTENNYGAYSAYYYRGILSKKYSFIEKACLIKDYLIKEMWSNSSTSNGPFHNVGVFWVGYNNFGWYTDSQGWGVLALGAYGPNGENFTRALEWLYSYGYGYGSPRHNQTYDNDAEIDGFDFWEKGVKNSTWLEGTEGVAAAYYSIGDNETGDYFHNQTGKVISDNGGIICSFSKINSLDIRHPDNSRYNSVASTVWYYLNEKKINPFKINNIYNDSGDLCKVNYDELFLDDLEFRTFLFFYENTDEMGFTIESTAWPTSSIASSGFYLTSIPIAVERGWINYEDGYKMALTTLNSYYDDPNDQDDFYVESKNGFFPHWFDRKTGKWNGVDCFSSIDTSIFMAGVLTVRQYFAGTEIENISTKLYENVDWEWMLNGSDTLSMGWNNDTGFLQSRWEGYNEGMLAVLLALGSPTHPIDNETWNAWTKTYNYKNYNYGNHNYSFVESSSTSLFTYQYPHVWFDFRGKTDKSGINYFQNSINATLENRDYCIKNPNNHTGYGVNVWGLTASECPLHNYNYGAHGPRQCDDGTISPAGAGGSIIFTPKESIEALRYMNETYGNNLCGKYGFKDAFNLGINWYSPTYIGIDEGVILTMIENYRSGLVQSLFMNNECIKNAMQKAEFTDIDTTPPVIMHVERNNNTITATIIDNTNISSVFLCFNNSTIEMNSNGQNYSANLSNDTAIYYITANDRCGNNVTSRVFILSEIPKLSEKAKNIFDLIEMLEYLSGEKNLENLIHTKTYYDLNDDRTINLLDVFVLINKIILNN